VAGRKTRAESRSSAASNSQRQLVIDRAPGENGARYSYYGDLMLGGSDYQNAIELANAKCRELNQPKTQSANYFSFRELRSIFECAPKNGNALHLRLSGSTLLHKGF
jgi:hypothetical protein